MVCLQTTVTVCSQSLLSLPEDCCSLHGCGVSRLQQMAPAERNIQFVVGLLPIIKQCVAEIENALCTMQAVHRAKVEADGSGDEVH